MASFSSMTNSAAFNAALTAVNPQSVTDNVAKVGDVIDRSKYGYPLSAAYVAAGSYTVATGASGDTYTVTLSVTSSAAANMSSPTTVATYSAVLPWVSNGALKEWCVTLPLNLLNAGQFLQATLTVHGAGAGTYTVPVAGAVCNFGGFSPRPATAYANTGYVGTTPA